MFGIEFYPSSPKKAQRNVLNKQKFLRIFPKEMIIHGKGNGVNSSQFVRLRGVCGAFVGEQQHLAFVY